MGIAPSKFDIPCSIFEISFAGKLACAADISDCLQSGGVDRTKTLPEKQEVTRLLYRAKPGGATSAVCASLRLETSLEFFRTHPDAHDAAGKDGVEAEPPCTVEQFVALRAGVYPQFSHRLRGNFFQQLDT